MNTFERFLNHFHPLDRITIIILTIFLTSVIIYKTYKLLSGYGDKTLVGL